MRPWATLCVHVTKCWYTETDQWCLIKINSHNMLAISASVTEKKKWMGPFHSANTRWIAFRTSSKAYTSANLSSCWLTCSMCLTLNVNDQCLIHLLQTWGLRHTPKISLSSQRSKYEILARLLHFIMYSLANTFLFLLQVGLQSQRWRMVWALFLALCNGFSWLMKYIFCLTVFTQCRTTH